MGLRGSDTFRPIEWLRDLTYNEIHAATYGVGLGGALGAGVAVAPGAYLTVATATLSLALLLYGISGSKEYISRTHGRASKAERVVLVAVRTNPHYYIGGFALGFALGGVVVEWSGVAG